MEKLWRLWPDKIQKAAVKIKLTLIYVMDMETRPVGRKNKLVLSRAEMRMIRIDCGVKLSDKVAYVE